MILFEGPNNFKKLCNWHWWKIILTRMHTFQNLCSKYSWEKTTWSKFVYIFSKLEFRRAIIKCEYCFMNLFLYDGYQMFSREFIFVSQKNYNVFEICYWRELVDFSGFSVHKIGIAVNNRLPRHNWRIC